MFHTSPEEAYHMLKHVRIATPCQATVMNVPYGYQTLIISKFFLMSIIFQA